LYSMPKENKRKNEKTAFQIWLEDKLGREFNSPEELKAYLRELWEKDPDKFGWVVSELKRLGDEIATREGVSISLKDLEPHKEYLPKGDISIEDALKLQKELPKKIIEDLAAQGNMFAEFIKSKIRGKPLQLLQLLVSPLSFADTKNQPFPFVIKRSFAEGLEPEEYFASAVGARRGIVSQQLATSEPGALSKALIGNVAHYVVTMKDCGTHRGMKFPIDSPFVLDRYLAHDHGQFKRNTLVTPQVREAMKKAGFKEIEVRTPMTCMAKEGVCAYCLGPVGDRKLPEVGFNAGAFSGQVITEPMTQFALSFKHIGGLSAYVKEDAFPLVKQMFTMPSGGTFKQKATLAEVSGKVTKVEKSPLGGWVVTIKPDKGKPVEHFVRPDVKPTVKEGDEVEQGDLISTGYAHPKEVLKLKGLEKGRQYLAQAIWNIYQSQGIDIHPKHFEAVVKALTNYAIIKDPRDTSFVQDEVVDIPGLEKYLSERAKKVKKQKAVGKYTARSYGFLLPGQKIERHHLDQLPEEVEVVDSAPEVEPYITSITKLHHHVPDVLVGLSRAELKKVLTDAVWYGKTSDLGWYHPIPKWVMGTITPGSVEKAKKDNGPLGEAK
jgi:hypothetical protein